MVPNSNENILFSGVLPTTPNFSFDIYFEKDNICWKDKAHTTKINNLNVTSVQFFYTFIDLCFQLERESPLKSIAGQLNLSKRENLWFSIWMNLVLPQQQQQKTVQNGRGFRDLRNESNMQNKIRTNYI